MSESGWIRHGFRIGLLEFRRTLRALRRNKIRATFMAIGAVIPSLIGAAVVVAFADVIRGIETISIQNGDRGMIALSWLFAVFLVGQRVVSVRTRIEAEPFVLTSVSARAVAGGLLIAETLRSLAYLVPLVLLSTGVCVFLLGSPASLVLIPGAAVLFAATAVVTGSACGYAVAWLVAISPFVAHHRTALGGLGTLLGIGGYALFFYPQIGGVDQSSLAWLPVSWFVDLALTGSGLAASSYRPVGALLGSVAILLVGSVIVERLTTTLWFTDPVSTDGDSGSRAASGEDTQGTTRRDALATAVRPLAVPRALPMPTRRVAEWALLRTRRDPNRLLFLVLPVFAIGSTVINAVVQFDAIDTVAAPLAAVALPWVVGSLFATNPFGDEGAVLPVTLTAVSGRQYVRGLVVPGVLIGLPVVPLVTGLATITSPYTIGEQLGLVALSVFLTCVAVVITPAIGMLLPRFSAISVGQSRDVIPPRMSAVAVHAVLTVVPGTLLAGLVVSPEMTHTALAGVSGFAPAFLLDLLASATSDVFAVPADWFIALGDWILVIDRTLFRFGGGGVVTATGTLVSVLSYRYAVRRFDRYTPA